jgi:hypothetical protein
MDRHLGEIHSEMAGRIPGRCGQDSQELLEVLRVVIRLPNEGHVREVAVDLMTSKGQRIPEAFLPEALEEASQFLMSQNACGLGLAPCQLGQGFRQP